MPTATVIDFRGLLFRRIGEYAVLADLDDAMARAARQCGLTPASATKLVDDDLLLLEAADFDKFAETAELRSWESILGNATDMGLRDAAIDEPTATVRDAAREKIKTLSAYVKTVHGVGLARLTLGTIGLNFQAGADSEFDALVDES